MKRFLKYLALAAAAVMTIVSCSEEKRKKALLPNISGKAGEVIVVIDQGIWEGSVGTVLRDSLAADCPYLPQREPLYTLVNVAPSGFNNMFQIHRNIIIVNVSSSVTEPGILFKKDQWAAPQCVIYINASDSDEAASIIKENSQKMITVLEQAERDRLMANTKKYEELKLSPVVTEMVGGSPRFRLPAQEKDRGLHMDYIRHPVHPAERARIQIPCRGRRRHDESGKSHRGKQHDAQEQCTRHV